MRVLYFTATLIFFSLVPSAIGGTSAFEGDFSPAPTPTPAQSGKRNERPTPKTESKGIADIAVDSWRFRYVFSQPNFVYSRIVIEHDSVGRGTLSFDRMNAPETIVEEIEISARVMGRLRAAFDALNFLESDEQYQHRRDYSHLGNIEITLSNSDKTRTVDFNWTENSHARALMDDYRRIGQQNLWVFDITLSRQNQPLDSPGVMLNLENLLRRNEIADPEQLLSFLDDLSRDERLPLIARNRASSIAQSIRKK
jgi:hypothetical protein